MSREWLTKTWNSMLTCVMYCLTISFHILYWFSSNWSLKFNWHNIPRNVGSTREYQQCWPCLAGLQWKLWSVFRGGALLFIFQQRLQSCNAGCGLANVAVFIITRSSFNLLAGHTTWPILLSSSTPAVPSCMVMSLSWLWCCCPGHSPTVVLLPWSFPDCSSAPLVIPRL